MALPFLWFKDMFNHIVHNNFICENFVSVAAATAIVVVVVVVNLVVVVVVVFVAVAVKSYYNSVACLKANQFQRQLNN